MHIEMLYILETYDAFQILFHPKYQGLVVGWVLRNINTCRWFNAKSIFMQMILFKKIQFSMSTQFICQNISISNYSVYSNRANSV